MAKKEDVTAAVKLTFASKADVEKYIEAKKSVAKPGVSRKTPEELKATWEKKIAHAEEFEKMVRANAVEKDGVAVACIPTESLRAFLGGKAKSQNAVAQLAKREFAIAGTIGDRAVRTDKDRDLICILPKRLEKAPGDNIAEKIIHAKAATQGQKKFGSLVKSLGRFWKVDVTEAQVKAWLASRKGAKKPKATPKQKK